MTLRDLTLLACKMVALFLLLTSISWLLGDVNSLLNVKQNSGMEMLLVNANLPTISYWQIGSSFLQTAVVTLIWLRSPQIAKRLVPESTFDHNLVIDEKWIAPAIGMVGIILIVIGLRGIATAVSIIYGYPPPPPELIGQLITKITQIILGAALYLMCHRIAKKLRERWQNEVGNKMVLG